LLLISEERASSRAPFPPKPRGMRWKSQYKAPSNLWCFGMSEFVDGLRERIGVNNGVNS